MNIFWVWYELESIRSDEQQKILAPFNRMPYHQHSYILWVHSLYNILTEN